MFFAHVVGAASKGASTTININPNDFLTWIGDVGSNGSALIQSLVSTQFGRLFVGAVIVGGALRWAYGSVRRGGARW